VLRDKQAILQELLVLRCKRGEHQALSELIHQWEDRLFYYVRRLVATEEDTRDVLQQTWIKVIKGIKSLDDPERLPAWLYKIARYTVLSHWRMHHRMHDFQEEEDDLVEIAAPEEDDHFDNAEQVHRSVRHPGDHCPGGVSLVGPADLRRGSPLWDRLDGLRDESFLARVGELEN